MTKRFGHSMCVPAGLAALALGVVTACSGSAEQPTQEQARAQEEGNDETTGPDLSGAAFFHRHPDDREHFLSFHDLDDGSMDARVSLQDLVLAAEQEGRSGLRNAVDDLAFSSDFGYTVIQLEEGLLLGELDEQGQAYEVGDVLSPEEGASFNDGEITYEAPQFSPDGTQLWFEENTEHGEEDSRILAVGLDDPTAEPEHMGEAPSPVLSASEVEEAGANRQRSGLSAPPNAYAITDEHELVVYSAPESESENEEGLGFLVDPEGGDVMPWDFVRTGDGRFIGPLDGSAQESNQTSLSVFELSDDGMVSDEELLVEAEGNPISRYWYDSEGDRFLLRTSDGYYWQETDSSAEPELAFTDFEFGDDSLTDAYALGLHSPRS